MEIEDFSMRKHTCGDFCAAGARLGVGGSESQAGEMPEFAGLAQKATIRDHQP